MKKNDFVLITLLFALILSCTRLSDKLDSPTGLQCEYHANPAGIDVEKPRFSWIVRSGLRNQKQSAYRILVATDPELLKSDRADAWNSGKIASDGTLQIAYNGEPLASATTYFWKVRSWDDIDRPSFWSEAHTFSTGLLNDEDWQASWIRQADSTASIADTIAPTAPRKRKKRPYEARPADYFRKTFTLEKPIRQALLFVTALGNYEFHINGQRVGEDYFMPGWTDYHKRLYYNSYDVTDLVNDSLNVMGAILADGWYAGNVANRGQDYYGEKTALRGQLSIEYEDGERFILGTDTSWRTGSGPICEADMQGGETYDARLEMPGWTTVDFDASAWQPAATAPTPHIALQAYPGATVQKISEISPVSIRRTAKGRFIVDMGQNFSGWARLRVQGMAGDSVIMRFAEKLKSPDSLFVKNLRSAKATDTYVLKGSGMETWEPRFTFHGFQYIEVNNYPGELKKADITGVVLHSDLPRSGFFQSSDTLINRIYQNVLWTQKSNFLDIPMDCPQRDERMGWTGDAQVFMGTSIYNMNVGSFFTRWMQDVVDGQFADGRFPSTAPRIYRRVAAGWGDAGIIIPWSIYQAYDDTRLIRKHYDAMTKWMNFLEAKSDTFINKQGSYGDWQNPDAETPIEVLATAHFANSARLMENMARSIDKAEDVQRYKTLFFNIRDRFVEKFVSDSGKIEGDTQGAYALALSFDLLSGQQKEQAIWHLRQKIRERGGHLSTGLMCTGLLFRALVEAGETDIAYQLLQNTSFPSWGYQIANGATTTWERWDGYSAEKGFHEDITNSFNHYAFGSVGEWLYKMIGGIDADGPGFQHIIIHPRPGGGLDWAKTSYESIRGKISTDWRWEENTFYLDVTIPANTTATVILPAESESQVFESDTPMQENEWLNFVKLKDGKAVIEIGSGGYEFKSVFSQKKVNLK